MKILFRSTLFIVLTVVIFGGAVMAQSDIMIVKEGAKKISLDISGIQVPAGSSAGALFRQTLENDLKRSGWFEIAPAGRAAIVARGQFSQAGNAVSCNCEVINTASARVFFRRAFKADRKHVRRLAHSVADAMVFAVKKVPGIALTRIAMVGAHGARKDIYLCDADGNNMTKVTSKGAICISPNWWPDAKNIVYTSYHKKFPDLYRLDLTNKKQSK